MATNTQNEVETIATKHVVIPDRISPISLIERINNPEILNFLDKMYFPDSLTPVKSYLSNETDINKAIERINESIQFTPYDIDISKEKKSGITELISKEKEQFVELIEKVEGIKLSNLPISNLDTNKLEYVMNLNSLIGRNGTIENNKIDNIYRTLLKNFKQKEEDISIDFKCEEPRTVTDMIEEKKIQIDIESSKNNYLTTFVTDRINLIDLLGVNEKLDITRSDTSFNIEKAINEFQSKQENPNEGRTKLNILYSGIMDIILEKEKDEIKFIPSENIEQLYQLKDFMKHKDNLVNELEGLIEPPYQYDNLSTTENPITTESQEPKVKIRRHFDYRDHVGKKKNPFRKIKRGIQSIPKNLMKATISSGIYTLKLRDNIKHCSLNTINSVLKYFKPKQKEIETIKDGLTYSSYTIKEPLNATNELINLESNLNGELEIQITPQNINNDLESKTENLIANESQEPEIKIRKPFEYHGRKGRKKKPFRKVKRGIHNLTKDLFIGTISSRIYMQDQIDSLKQGSLNTINSVLEYIKPQQKEIEIETINEVPVISDYGKVGNWYKSRANLLLNKTTNADLMGRLEAYDEYLDGDLNFTKKVSEIAKETGLKTNRIYKDRKEWINEMKLDVDKGFYNLTDQHFGKINPIQNEAEEIIEKKEYQPNRFKQTFEKIKYPINKLAYNIMF